MRNLGPLSNLIRKKKKSSARQNRVDTGRRNTGFIGRHAVKKKSLQLTNNKKFHRRIIKIKP